MTYLILLFPGLPFLSSSISIPPPGGEFPPGEEPLHYGGHSLSSGLFLVKCATSPSLILMKLGVFNLTFPKLSSLQFWSIKAINGCWHRPLCLIPCHTPSIFVLHHITTQVCVVTQSVFKAVVANLWRIKRSMMAHCLCAGGDKLMFLNKFNKKIQGWFWSRYF